MTRSKLAKSLIIMTCSNLAKMTVFWVVQSWQKWLIIKTCSKLAKMAVFWLVQS